MPNKYVNKVVIGKETKLDLTADTVTPDKLAKGITAHDKSGAPITGTSTKDADTSDATAAVAEVLNGKTFYARGAKMTGTMPNNGEVNGEISTVSGKYTIPMGMVYLPETVLISPLTSPLLGIVPVILAPRA